MDKRIKKISELVQGTSAVDIGTDHGYLLIELSKRGCTKLLAVEKNEGPLQNCINSLQKENLNNKVDCILSDGLQKITIEQITEYNNIIIAGMGGDLISSIINNDLEKFKFSRLILQPNNNDEKLRKYLNAENFEIEKEVIVEQSSRFYEIIVAKYTQNKIHKLSEDEILFGTKEKQLTSQFSKKWKEEEKYLNELILNIKGKGKKINFKLEKKLKKIRDKRSEIEAKRID